MVSRSQFDTDLQALLTAIAQLIAAASPGTPIDFTSEDTEVVTATQNINTALASLGSGGSGSTPPSLATTSNTADSGGATLKSA